jgi:hypothetical protein
MWYSRRLRHWHNDSWRARLWLGQHGVKQVTLCCECQGGLWVWWLHDGQAFAAADLHTGWQHQIQLRHPVGQSLLGGARFLSCQFGGAKGKRESGEEDLMQQALALCFVVLRHSGAFGGTWIHC